MMKRMGMKAAAFSYASVKEEVKKPPPLSIS
jgi:hypothetical protein